ncbi:metalloregulator ArsR/SmtB family transcription factor [Cocleimonas sp. KMM 6892]|uniref:ArsR/SmtB family transcription factor n=1 Tax=unclassified Cocleimonas TaxID=2639732 RepID=UPI002DBF3057|nr:MULTISPECIES: metalloregulator ArsR/SmtB family transcription factor [unclassified Cocleimonas]MEB8431761.1 metalloregulator ArsR/SmtB family transcription factor [Cocleimonas sp. KMM 6892]MEC4715153.1 metalloregulator ArsR/SmtB family transcription factor [Cocleimonas sp. KMM 6895]MEC4744033.1 metalloregulator ArsR/SmtB family transcription factor [Cocleimonas sp. KMM 6896]
MTIYKNSGTGHSPENESCKFLRGILAGSNLEDASRSLKAISHPLRLNILCVLGAGEVSVQDILKTVGTTQSNVSQHLCLLRDKGIVSSRKDANRVYYSIKDETVMKILGNDVVDTI